MAYDFQVTVDCSHPHQLAEWWADALGWGVEPTDEEFIRRMVREGKAQESDTMEWRGVLVWRIGAAITGPGEPARRVLFQGVPEPKTVKNRIHLDVRVGPDKIEQESARLTDAGATELYRGSQGPFRWITLADPEGNELCLT